LVTITTLKTSGKNARRRNSVTDSNRTSPIPAVNGRGLTKGRDLFQAAETLALGPLEIGEVNVWDHG
jgi:hypothetical protein